MLSSWGLRAWVPWDDCVQVDISLMRIEVMVLTSTPIPACVIYSLLMVALESRNPNMTKAPMIPPRTLAKTIHDIKLFTTNKIRMPKQTSVKKIAFTRKNLSDGLYEYIKNYTINRLPRQIIFARLLLIQKTLTKDDAGGGI